MKTQNRIQPFEQDITDRRMVSTPKAPRIKAQGRLSRNRTMSTTEIFEQDMQVR